MAGRRGGTETVSAEAPGGSVAESRLSRGDLTNSWRQTNVCTSKSAFMKYVLNHDIEFDNSLNLLLITVVKIR